MLHRHRLGLGGTVDVDELRQDVARLVLFKPLLGLLRCHRSSPRLTLPAFRLKSSSVLQK